MSSLKRKLTYSIGANIISLIVSVFTSICIPRIMASDIGEYGYFQIFVFYSGYIGFLHFGFCDGIILRAVGNKYEDLDKELYSGQFWILLFGEGLLGILILLFGGIISNNYSYRFICLMIGINIVLIIPKAMLLNILQVTEKVKEYAIITIFTRSIFFAFVLLCIAFSFRKFEYFVVGQTLGEAIGLVVAIWFARNIVFSHPAKLDVCIREISCNTKAGSKILISNIAGLLFAGIPRILVQTKYDTVLYGKVAFAFVISNMVLSFISAVEIVLYPEFKGRTITELKHIYIRLESKLMCIIFSTMVLYYPGSFLIARYLPQFQDSLRYMVYLIPMCAFSAKMNMLIQNYMKVFRMEMTVMKVNLTTVLISVGLTMICFKFYNSSPELLMLTVVVTYAFRCLYAEVGLNKKMRVFSTCNELCDLILSAIFVIVMSSKKGWGSVGIYSSCLAVYLLIRNRYRLWKRKDV